MSTVEEITLFHNRGRGTSCATCEIVAHSAELLALLRDVHEHGVHYNGASAWQRTGDACAPDCEIAAAIEETSS